MFLLYYSKTLSASRNSCSPLSIKFSSRRQLPPWSPNPSTADHCCCLPRCSYHLSLAPTSSSPSACNPPLPGSPCWTLPSIHVPASFLSIMGVHVLVLPLHRPSSTRCLRPRGSGIGRRTLGWTLRHVPMYRCLDEVLSGSKGLSN